MTLIDHAIGDEALNWRNEHHKSAIDDILDLVSGKNDMIGLAKTDNPDLAMEPNELNATPLSRPTLDLILPIDTDRDQASPLSSCSSAMSQVFTECNTTNTSPTVASETSVEQNQITTPTESDDDYRKCQYCGQTFRGVFGNRRSNCLRHQHSSCPQAPCPKRRWECSFENCGQSYSREDNLKNHVIQSHGSPKSPIVDASRSVNSWFSSTQDEPMTFF